MCYNKVIELKPNEPQAYYQKGIALLREDKKKNIKSAEKCFILTLDICPNYKDARSMLESIKNGN